ncbi:hypothetical protein MNBD_NITROSPIRAE02-640 [hydrothermal vent metagenome]|uniref:Uncharacterized protein n=1 Tax=hydrothermal vent metagenome TaxID=652676 RepID=A0A3B1D055_9ZZZZ
MDFIRLPYCAVPFLHSPTHTRTDTPAIVSPRICLSTLRTKVSVCPGMVESLAIREMHVEKCREWNKKYSELPGRRNV